MDIKLSGLFARAVPLDYADRVEKRVSAWYSGRKNVSFIGDFSRIDSARKKRPLNWSGREKGTRRVRELPSGVARLESTRKLATGENVRLASAMVPSIRGEFRARANLLG